VVFAAFKATTARFEASLALLIFDWTMQGTNPEGNQVNLSGTTADVAARAPTAGATSSTTRSVRPDHP
jgi:hypothetical protein